ncbi:nucleoside triphosphate pyrophosphohydrolase [soil metagenome]
MPGERSRSAGEALALLDELTRVLRVECPWDRQQDERSIVPHTVEEAYELADAAASGDDAKLLDELGDVLFQVHFLSLLMEERGAGGLAEVAEGVRAKLIRRHPHVFPESEQPPMPVDSSASRPGSTGSDEGSGEMGVDQVLSQWDRIKKDVEGRGVDDPFSDVPENLPGLLYARKILRRIEPSAGNAEPLADEERDEAERRVGEMLIEAVALSRRLGVDPELAVRAEAGRRRDGHRETLEP